MSVEKFRRRLETLMIDGAVSKHALSAKANVERKSVKNYLKGKNYPRYDSLIKISNVFNVSADYLLGLSNKRGKSWHAGQITKEKCHNSLSKVLKTYMEKDNLSDDAMAEKLGTSKSVFLQWIDSVCMPETSSLIRIAKALDVSVDVLLGKEG